MDEKVKKLMALKKKGDKGLSDSDVAAKKAALDDLLDMAKGAMGGKLAGLKKVTVASDSQEGLQKGLDLAKKKLGEMHASDETEMDKVGHGEGEEVEGDAAEEASETPEEESAEGTSGEALEEMSEEELAAMLEKVKAELAKKKMAK